MGNRHRAASLSGRPSLAAERPRAARVLRDTRAPLSLTIPFAAGVAALAVAGATFGVKARFCVSKSLSRCTGCRPQAGISAAWAASCTPAW